MSRKRRIHTLQSFTCGIGQCQLHGSATNADDLRTHDIDIRLEFADRTGRDGKGREG